eukprot:544423-Prymnesium_polylepis.2
MPSYATYNFFFEMPLFRTASHEFIQWLFLVGAIGVRGAGVHLSGVSHARRSGRLCLVHPGADQARHARDVQRGRDPAARVSPVHGRVLHPKGAALGLVGHAKADCTRRRPALWARGSSAARGEYEASWTVVAQTNVQVWRLAAAGCAALVAEHPFFGEQAAVLHNQALADTASEAYGIKQEDTLDDAGEPHASALDLGDAGSARG